MKKVKILLITISTLSIIGVGGFHYVFKSPEQIELITFDHLSDGRTSLSHHFTRCIEQNISQPVDNDGQLNVFVWNIYKQQRPYWSSILDQYSNKQPLLLLQENSLNKPMTEWLIKRELKVTQMVAFSMLNEPTGVATIATTGPISTCGFTALEPYLRLSKSALVSYFALSNGQTLAVANFHSVNFTLDVTEYRDQLITVADVLRKHVGPIIVGGDFNSWSEDRSNVLVEFVSSLGLEEVSYQPDHRKQFFYNGLALDHLYFRGLTIKKSDVLVTDASDHNPMIAEFAIEH